MPNKETSVAVSLRGQMHSLTLKNPVMTASGTFGYGAEFARYGRLSSLGGIIVKGLSLQPREGNPTPRIAETPCGMLNAVGLQNDGVEEFLEHKLPALPWKDVPVIANIYATSAEEFGELAARLNGVEGVAALEVNISCPNVHAGGSLFGQDPVQAAAVVRAVRSNAPDKHIIVKLTPNVTSIADIAKSVEAEGADSVSCINTLLGMAVDLRRRAPRLANVVGGLSGPCIKPVALRCVWQTAHAVRIPVIGVGGICTAEDLLEFILVGASAVEIGTANFMRPDAAFHIAETLPGVMEHEKILSLKMRGYDGPTRTLSVCATSSHDTATLRMSCPEDPSPETVRGMLAEVLAYPSMLAIFPIQDWLALSGELRNPDRNERINEPADPHHHWRWRLHLDLSTLAAGTAACAEGPASRKNAQQGLSALAVAIRELLAESGRLYTKE